MEELEAYTNERHTRAKYYNRWSTFYLVMSLLFSFIERDQKTQIRIVRDEDK